MFLCSCVCLSASQHPSLCIHGHKISLCIPFSPSHTPHRILSSIPAGNITYIWTSGRLCDFTGCEEREDLKPLNIKGWFWSNTNTKMADTNRTPPGWRYQPWSDKGHTGGPQPDNAEFDINQTSESCMGVLNNIYKDGIKWHDIACYHKKPFVCEDSDQLLQYVEGLKRQQSGRGRR